MIIAISSVTKYISDSRKSSYVDTAKEIISGARNLVNSGDLEMYDTDATYYIESSCIKTENDGTSPYGAFTNAYVVVTYDGNGYTYYWTSVDEAGQGIKDIVLFDKLDTEIIESDLNNDDISTLRSIDGRSKTILVSKRNDCQKEGPVSEGIIQINGKTGKEVIFVCKRATTLHTKTCERTSDGCGSTIGNGNTITYGTLVSGTPKAGDAYDCDVNNDGSYDSATERFYYVTSDGDNSTLIYYTNMNGQTAYAYDSSGQNYHGPRTGYQYLPSTTEWSNSLLIKPGTRQIIAENGLTSTGGGSKPIESFTYTDKAARLLTTQEINSACGITAGSVTTGELDNCRWLMENIGYYEKYSGTRNQGYWLETPRSENPYNVWGVNGGDRRVSHNYSYASITTTYGVRPAITIKTSDLG